MKVFAYTLPFCDKISVKWVGEFHGISGTTYGLKLRLMPINFLEITIDDVANSVIWLVFTLLTKNNFPLTSEKIKSDIATIKGFLAYSITRGWEIRKNIRNSKLQVCKVSQSLKNESFMHVQELDGVTLPSIFFLRKMFEIILVKNWSFSC